MFQDAISKINIHKENPAINPDLFHSNPAKYWDKFYQNNQDSFFKDRHWISAEFPLLFERIKNHQKDSVFQFIDLGCGVGNTIYPLLRATIDTNILFHGADYSINAINVLKTHELYDKSRINAFVYDITSPEFPISLANSLDVVSCVFVLSALHPNQHIQAVNNIYNMLKPGGIVLLRDYGRYDLAQVRMKKNRFIDDNFYIRGDGTRVYFFSLEDVLVLFQDRFKVIQNTTRNELIVNRKLLLKMYRCWLQCCYEKI